MDEVDIEFLFLHWNDTFCLYDPTDPECPYCCIGADQVGLLYIYGAFEDEDMDWNLYQPKATDRFFIVAEPIVDNLSLLH